MRLANTLKPRHMVLVVNTIMLWGLIAKFSLKVHLVQWHLISFGSTVLCVGREKVCD